MSTSPRVMVLDGDYPHTLAIQSELKRYLSAEIISVASSRKSPGHLSRHTDQRVLALPSSSVAFGDSLKDLVTQHRPDLVVPVGFSAHSAVISRAEELLPHTRLLVPDANSFKIAASKTKTYEAAAEVGVRVPREYGSDHVKLAELLPADIYPVFAKARFERGGVSTALIRSADELRSFDPEPLGGDVIFQEFIDGNSFTYAHCGYFVSGQPLASMEHIERRSVPRRGGSGTRVQVAEIPELAVQAKKLLSRLSWTGIAQVEFKMAPDGEYVLMEINPKLWASYAVATMGGSPIVATAAAHVLGLSLPHIGPRGVGKSMVFPFREFVHVVTNLRDENLITSAMAMVWPPARPDFEVTDLWAHVPHRHNARK